MPYYEKLAKLPEKEQDAWDTYLLSSGYTLDQAEHLLDFLIDDELWMPRIFKVIVDTVHELKIARLPEVAERLDRTGVELGLPFLWALVHGRYGAEYRVGYHGGAIWELCCFWLMDDRKQWIAQTRDLLLKTPLLTSSKLISHLGVQQVLRHHVCFRLFDTILEEVGIWSETVTLKGCAQIADAEEIAKPIHYYPAGPMNVDKFFHFYRDPSIRLRDCWDTFYFDKESLLRLFQTIAALMRTRDLPETSMNKLSTLLTNTSGVESRKSAKLLRLFLENRISNYHTMMGREELEPGPLLAQAGLELTHGGSLVTTPKPKSAT